MSAELEPEPKEPKEPIKVSFSWPQLAGGALAAATAAAIGSTLGVAGTIVGAAVASLVGAVAGTLYSAGIDQTHRKVTSVITRQGKDAGLADGAVEESVVELIPVPVPAPGTAVTRRPDRGRYWKPLAITATLMFLVALAIITVVELGLGRAIGGGEGTTVSQVVRPSRPSASAKPSPTPTETPSPTATPSVTPSEPAPSLSEPTTPAPSMPVPTEAAATPTPSPPASEPPSPTATS